MGRVGEQAREINRVLGKYWGSTRMIGRTSGVGDWWEGREWE